MTQWDRLLSVLYERMDCRKICLVSNKKSIPWRQICVVFLRVLTPQLSPPSTWPTFL